MEIWEKHPGLVKFYEEHGDEIEAIIVRDFIDIVEGKSKQTEIEQRKHLLIAFFATLPGSMPTLSELETMITNEGWDKKPLKEMVNYYAPPTIGNYKQMNMISRDYTPKTANTQSSCCV